VRVERLRRAAEAIRRERLELAMATLLEVGKSRLEALGEVEESIDLINYYCDQVEHNAGWELSLRTGPGNESGHDRLRPYGVFAVVAPFNYPVALAVGMTTAALLGGNSVVLKPAPGAALSAPMLARIFVEAGLPPGVFNLVCGDRDTGALLTAHPGIDGIAFTGSHEVGMQLLRQSAAGPFMKPVLAELGGKNAAIVAASADLDAAAAGVARSAFGLSGQKCSSCSRVYVQRGLRDAFVERLSAIAGRLAVGDPRIASTFTGPVIGPASARRFEAAVAAACAAGPGHLLLGGERLRGGAFDHGAYLSPTVVVDLPADHDLNRRELFLPLLSLQTFDRLDDAIDAANASPLGLSAGIYARDAQELDRFWDRIEAGVLYANRPSGATTGAWPGFQTFCGWKGSGSSGKGGLGPHYVQQFMREQSRTIAG
jgi:1-pyrroline-5-carboxylate dehydrogenase